jgi:hypothetical protein
MSEINNKLVSDLEEKNVSLNDFGDLELNKVFQNLDPETQNKINKITDMKSKQNILQSISNPNIQKFYNELNDKSKAKLDKINISDKYLLLRNMLKEKEKKESENKNNNLNNIISEKGDKANPIPEELFYKNEEPDFNAKPNYKNKSPQIRFEELIKKFYSVNPYIKNSKLHNELEVKFGTKGIKPFTRNDYDNVIKKLKSIGFTTPDSAGKYYLRVNCEFLDSISGRFKLSDVRTEISGLHNIKDYCKNNDLKSIYTSNPTCVNFISKKMAFVNNERMFPVDFDDFNFRVSYQTEEQTKTGIKNFIIENWKKSKKEFRYINRVSFEHPDYPVIIDISMVKFSNRYPDKYGREGRGSMVRVYNIEDSNVFNNSEIYEIEIEIDNSKIGPGTQFNTPESIIAALRKAIKHILGGLQQTNYPISYNEQKEVLESYMKVIWNDEYQPDKRIGTQYFIGPNSITLQIVNISPINDNTNETNIRKDFVVTDKADGERHLMFISNKGKIYLINTNMDVIFTGAKTNNENCFNTIIDGELILHDKNGKFINLYAAFDIYIYQKNDVRRESFMPLNNNNDIYKSRYNLLKHLITSLKPVSILDIKNKTNLLEQYIKNNDFISPIRIVTKEFFPMNNQQTIFNGCDMILKKEREQRFEYITDGLIFTHAYYGVGSNEIGKSGPKTKITWEKSFKWKPPQYNTIDFLVTTIKDTAGNDTIKTIFEDGITTNSSVQFSEYKMMELRCGFNEKKDGFINPCQDIIDDKLPQFVQRSEDNENKDNDYLPKRFYPTEPYDMNAGLCKIMLRTDDSGTKQMFSENNEVFTDNTIVEFRYDFDREDGWRWVPLRVRYDKTSKLRRGEKEYGNSYKVCNENWKSIHPAGKITEDMLCTGLNIPDVTISEDKYYNTPSTKFKTESMKNFHNLYVKKLLIKSVSKEGDTLIDFACGKAGDLPKWINARLSFVFGIDLSKDNLENRLDGACARYLKARKVNKNMPYALFVNGNSAFNVKNGNAMLNDKAKQITSSIFGIGTKDSDKIGKGVARQYGKGEDGFNVASCQFALHYFLENPDTLKGFMKNLSECTKLNGYFIGTCYDGKLMFNELKKIKTNESIQINDDGKKIWEVTKMYGSDIFEDDSSSIGYKINVYQESINQTISEYLVNFDYLDRVFETYGFKVISRDEAKQFGLPEGSGLFSELFMNMLDEISKNKYKSKDYGESQFMTSNEKRISFLNRYFVYKKIREVNTDKVELEISEYSETNIERNIEDTRQSKDIAKKEEKINKPKIRKLSKKILLIPATEATDETTIKDTKKKKQVQIVIESDDEN